MAEKSRDQEIQEMQFIEQSLNQILMQKQAFQMELSETKMAIKEVEKSGDEVYKIVGQLMVKAEKKKMEEDLKSKEKLLELRMKSIEKQEESYAGKLQELRDNILKSREKK